MAYLDIFYKINVILNHISNLIILLIQSQISYIYVYIASKSVTTVKSTAMVNFPDEIIVEVLLRLPVKSLCLFRCVSKPWLSLISDHNFIKTHLNRNTNEPEQLILISNISDFYSVDLKSFQFRDYFVAVHLKFPREQNPNRGFDIWGSCDGLLLILDICFSCILVNPSTRQCRKLPKSSFSESKFHLNSYGLGHDSSNDDYKVVRISNHDQDANCADNMVSVYTLRTNLWRRVEDSPYDHTVHGPSRGILVRGALHWLARKGVGSNKSTVIVSFDLADENFRDMDSVDNFILVEELGVLGGCLCVLVPGYGFCDDVWVMKEYGMRDSWIKFTVNCNNFCKPLCLSTAGEVLLEVNQRKLVLFNPQERESKELVVQGSPYRFEAGTYMESLVSPNFSNINDHEGSRVPQARPEACDDSKTEAESSMTTTFRLDESSNPPSPRFSPFD